MDIYLAILKYNFMEYIRYPFELLSVLIQRVIKISFLLILWKLVLDASGKSYNLNELLSYFLLADGIAEITMALRTKFGTLLRDSIKSGSISNFLIKPIKLIPAMYATTWGKRSIYNVPGLISISIGIVLNPPRNAESILLFIIFFLIAGSIAFAFNMFEGIMTFYVESPGGIMNSLVHIVRVFSGAMAPLSFFPEKLRVFLSFTPFPAMVYGPINSLGYSTIDNNILNELSIAMSWAIIINILMFYFWKKGIKKYEAYGL